MNDWTFVTGDDEALHDVLSGRSGTGGYPWPRRAVRRVTGREQGVGVLVQASAYEGRDRPGAVVVSEDDGRRLFGRYSQLRSDLSPLSAWTHILEWEQFDQLQTQERLPDLAGFETSWIGLSIAEALILSDRPLAQLKLAACLATPTFALARAHALWPTETIESVLRRYDLGQRLVRANEGAPNRLRDPLMDVWRTLLSVSVPLPREPAGDLRIVTQGLLALLKARASGDPEARALGRVLDVPEARFLERLDDMPPEMRLREFDRLVANIESLAPSDKSQRNALLFLAGYLATVAAGGSSSLGLAERLSSRWPQIAAWAYVIGGVGEVVTWTSSFDGLGRLVARELSRPFRLDEPPNSDFALAEANILIDRGLQDPLVHLRVKQSRVLSVALLPGVNVSVPYADPHVVEPKTPTPAPVKSESRQAAPRQDVDPLAAFADALAPYLVERITALISPATVASSEPARRSSRSRGGGKREAQLPLDVERDRQR